MNAHRYQVGLIEPGPDGHAATLRATLEKRVKELGLDPAVHVAFFDETAVPGQLDARAPICGVYFGGPSRTQAASDAVDDLVKCACFILPVVTTVLNYQAQVPKPLHEINAQPIAVDDPDLERVASRVLEELGLMRARRFVFVSYRRVESAAVAQQIYRILDERSFGVFLDTYSVTYGRPFQQVLWDRLADADVLVFLDTKQAADSTWVEQEFTRANNLGIGLLRLIWPGTPERWHAELSDPFYLQDADFEPGAAPGTADATLLPDVIARIATRVEALRARSLAARRTRVVESFCRHADAAGLRRTIHPARHIDLHTKTGDELRVYPVIGHPDADQLQTAFTECGSTPGYLLYDALGMWDGRARHLRWLNDYLPIKSLPVTEVGSWLAKL